MAVEFGLRGRQHLLEPIEDNDDTFQARHHLQPPAAATGQPTAPVGPQAQPRSDSGDAGEHGEGQTGHGPAGDGEPGAVDLLQRLGSSPLGPQPDFTRWAANSGHSALNDLPPPQVQAPPPPATGPRVAYARGQDRYEPDDSFQNWQEEFAPPSALSATPPPVSNLVNVANTANAATPAPPTVTIDLETDGGSAQLQFSANQQAYLAPPPPQFALTATASAAATATSPPPSAPYLGERPADVAWLRDREAALNAVRSDFEAQRNQAQAQVPGFGATAGPGWVALGPTYGRDGSELAPAAGQLIVEVSDPNAPAQYSSDENNTYTPPPSQRYIFDEAAFTQHYQAQAFANPNSALQTLAWRGYDTDAASLLNAHPEIWGMATSDHAINAGPAQAGRAMGSIQMLAPIEMTLADPQNAALIKAYGGSPEPATSPVALEQVRLYGAERYAQMTRLSNAMQAVRDHYSQAVERAASSGAGPGWSLQPQTVRQHVGSSGDGDVYADVLVMQPAFDVDTFTNWYQAQGGLSNQAFKDFYGASHTTPGGWESNGEGSGTSYPSSTTFDNAPWQMTGFGGALQHAEFTSIDPNNHPSLNDDAFVGFDPVSGWITPTANLHQKQDWVFTAAVVAMVVVVSCVTYGAASTWATGAGYGAVAGAVGGAAAGAAGSFVSGAMNGNLTLKGVLQGALAGALTGAAGDYLKLGTIVDPALVAPGTVGGFVSNFTINTAVQALMQGKITDQMLLTSLATAAGTTLAAKLASGIDKAVKAGTLSPTEAFAAQGLAKMMTAAVRALASPDDPGYAFANALLNEVMQPLGDAARDAGAGAVTGGDTGSVGNGEYDMDRPVVTNPPPPFASQTVFDDDGNLMPGAVNQAAPWVEQKAQLRSELERQGIDPATAQQIASNYEQRVLDQAFDSFVNAEHTPVLVAGPGLGDVRNARNVIFEVENRIADGSLQGREIGRAIEDVYDAFKRLGASIGPDGPKPTVDQERAASRLVSLIGDLGLVAVQDGTTLTPEQQALVQQSRAFQAQSNLPDLFGAGASGGILALRQNRAVNQRLYGSVRPTGELGGRPLGRQEAIPENANAEFKRGIRLQNEALDTVAAAGYRVEHLPNANTNGNKNPEALIEGRVFDVYSPKAETSARNIMLQMGEKATPNRLGNIQTDRIVLNLSESQLTRNEVRLAFNAANTSIKEVIVIGPDRVIYRLP
jgi:Contact-dependent growth inhibition CdiA C-terminal domain